MQDQVLADIDTQLTVSAAKGDAADAQLSMAKAEADATQVSSFSAADFTWLLKCKHSLPFGVPGTASPHAGSQDCSQQQLRAYCQAWGDASKRRASCTCALPFSPDVSPDRWPRPQPAACFWLGICYCYLRRTTASERRV